MESFKTTAIILAAGMGTRMGSRIPKQFLELDGYPVLYYSLKTFEDSFIDEIIIVSRKEDIEYIQNNIVKEYGFLKVVKITEGGEQRADSVYNGLKCVDNCNYVFIHDGARPFVDSKILERVYEEVKKYKACVVGMPVKDTIKICDDNNFSVITPDRNRLWQIQTPQVFEYKLIKEAYDKLQEKSDVIVTDDASVVELFCEDKVKLVQGSYNNIKLTTPIDLLFGEEIIKNNKKSQNIY